MVGLIVLLAAGLYGGDFFGLRERLTGSTAPPARAPAVGRTVADAASPAAPEPSASPTGTRVRSWPWWQTVATFDGDGDQQASVTIDDGALQWRVTWRCASGDFLLAAAEEEEPLVDASCPDGEPGYATSTGAQDLQVTAAGSWEMEVEQQLDVPLEEAPLPAMTAPDAQAVLRGTFYDIDQSGRGTATVYRLADGSHALRLDDFFVTANVDLELRLSAPAAPRTTQEFRQTPNVFVEALPITAGSLNFRIPEDVDLDEYGSLVIWCPPALSAYAAATLEPVA